VFSSYPDHDVHLMNVDGSGIRQVTKFAYSSFPGQATISSNGAVIAFVAFDTREAPSNVQIFTVRADGSSLRQITSGQTAVSSPSLNGDGTRLAFLSGRDVFLASSDGTGVRPLTNFRISQASAPVLSEDGSRVAFGLGPAMAVPGTGSIGAIWVVNADGSGLRALYAPRSLNVQGILDAAEPYPHADIRLSFGGVVAGSLVSAFGTNFFAGDSITHASSLPLPESLAGIFLTMDGRPLPLVAVTPWQINAQIPPEQKEGPATFEVRFADGTRSNPVTQTVKALGPALFTLPGSDQAAVLHANTGTLADQAHPAQAGQALEIYASGLGQTVPFVPAGAAAPAKPLATTLVRPEVDIGGQPARVLFSGLTPGSVGLYQVNVVVPEGLQPGRHSIRLRVGNLESRRGSGMLPAYIWTR